MTVLPIIERELRIKARSPSTYWTRFAVALAGILVCLLQILASAAFGNAAAIGKGVFDGIVWAGFVLCCAGCLLTADVVSSERRQGTLGLLLLTRVNRFDLLLGKFGSVALTSVAALVVLLPMLLLPMLAGGVTAGEVLRKGCSLLNALFFTLAAGLFASTVARERPKAVGWALGLVLVLAIAPIALAPDTGSSSPSFIAFLSPVFTMIWQRHQPLSAWVISLLLVHTMAWLLVIAANAGLRWAIREESDAAPPLAPSFAPNPSLRSRSPPLEAGADVIEWLVRRQAGLNGAIWMATTVTVLYQLLGPWLFRFTRSPGLLAYGTMFLPWLAVSLVSGSLLAWATTRFFLQARQSGELELLLTTPLGTEAIISGQWRASKRLFRWPVAVVLAVSFLRMLWFVTQPARGDWLLYYVISPPLGMAYVLLEVAALCWAGMWFGLHQPRPAAAIAWTVGLTRGIPFLVSVFGQFVVTVFLMNIFGWGAPFSKLYWLLPQVLILLFFLWVIRRSKRRLSVVSETTLVSRAFETP